MVFACAATIAPARFPNCSQRQGASVALILSAVPESFSLVLSEAWAAGVPVVAPASGAFLERLSAPAVSTPAASAAATPALAAPAAARASGARPSGVAERSPNAPAALARDTATRSSIGQSSDEDAMRAGGLLISSDPSDEEIVAAVERARSMSWDALPTPPTAAQAAERHLALYREAGFIDETARS